MRNILVKIKSILKSFKEKIKSILKPLEVKIKKTTTVSSIIALILVFIVIKIVDSFFGGSTLVFRLLEAFLFMFLWFKFYLIFLSETDYSEKGVKVEDVYSRICELKNPSGIFYTPQEKVAILNAKMQQENSKHRKAIKREGNILIAIFILTALMFIFGGGVI